jgi:hypothetical protein
VNVTIPPRLKNALAMAEIEAREIVPLGGGANSRVFAVSDSGGRRVVAKLHHIEDGGASPRYEREKKFYAAAREVAEGFMARDLHWADASRVALLEFLDCAPLVEVSERDVRQAVTFVRLLQQADKAALAGASEAALRSDEHVEMVERRLRVLRTVADPQTAALVQQELIPRWEWVRARVRLTECPAIVSPSDYGFHNALCREGHLLCFFDFEHAGLDDPAKLVCDFFLRPGAGVPSEWLPAFCEAAGFKHDVKARAEGLMDLYRVKWACIALNEFTVEGARRREFAGADAPGRRAAQLAKARRLIREVGL